jgi:hypothetical protein
MGLSFRKLNPAMFSAAKYFISGNLKVQTQFGRNTYGWEDNIKIDIKNMV